MNSNSNNNSSSNWQSNDKKKESLVIGFVFGCLFLGSIFRMINRKIGLPYTPAIFVMGLIFGYNSNHLSIFGDSIEIISSIDPKGLLQIFLPILIFEKAFNMDWHVFRTEMSQILVLSLPCVIVNAFLIMISMKLLLKYEDEYYSWTAAFMFGSIISCTDPIAVVSLLKHHAASKRLFTLIEGESLINNAMGMILYAIALGLYKDQIQQPYQAIQLFCSLTFGGIALGIVLGFISGYLINRFYNDQILVINVTLMGGFLAYLIPETILQSQEIVVNGIICIVTIGVFLAAVGRSKINPDVELNLHAFWSFLVFLAQTTIFILAGIIFGHRVLNDQTGFIRTVDYNNLFLLYLIIYAARLLSLLLFYPLLRNKGYGMNFKEFIVVVHSGLRGAISIAYGMLAASDQQLTPILRDIFLFHIAGSVLLTLIFNAPTSGIIIRLFGILNEHRVKDQMYMNFLESMMEESKLQEEQLKNNSYMNLVDWNQVQEWGGMVQIQKEIKILEKKIEMKIREEKQEQLQQLELKNKADVNKLLDEELNGLTDQEKPMLSETRSRYLNVLQQSYCEQLQNSQTTGAGYLLLNASVNWDQDRFQERMSNWNIIHNAFYKYHYIKIFHDMRKLPIIGPIVRNLIFNHISFAYEVVVSYILAHKKAETLLDDFQVPSKISDMILDESQFNRDLAEHYLNDYLMLTYPEITKSIQTKKAANQLLHFQKKELIENQEWGHIDEKEYDQLRNIIDKKVIHLQYITPDFQKESSKQFIQNMAAFDFISESNLDKIMNDSTEKSYQSNERIMKENETAKNVFIILNGVGNEYCSGKISHLSIDKCAGKMVGELMLVTDNKHYLTSFISDSVCTVRIVPLKLMKALVNQNQDLESFIWKSCIFEFIRINIQNYQQLAQLTYDEIYAIITYSHFKKFQKGDIINLDKGCLFLQGFTLDNSHNQVERHHEYIANLQQDQIDASKFQHLNLTLYQHPKFIRPNKQLSLYVLKPTSVFIFMEYSQIEDIIQQSYNEASRPSAIIKTSYYKPKSNKNFGYVPQFNNKIDDDL